MRVRWVLAATVARADIPRLCDELVALFRDTGAAVVVCDVGAHAEADLTTVELLARLQLTARRHGRTIEVYRASPRLRALLAVTGVGESVPRCVPR